MIQYAFSSFCIPLIYQPISLLLSQHRIGGAWVVAGLHLVLVWLGYKSGLETAQHKIIRSNPYRS